jgi:hypothetical protein
MSTYKISNSQTFENKVKTEFKYLVNEFLFSNPIILRKDDEYRDRLLYTKDNIAIEILNAWHPSDYGFEVNYYSDRGLLNMTNDRIQTHEMVYYKLKEEQNEDLSFIEEGAKILKKFLLKKISII